MSDTSTRIGPRALGTSPATIYPVAGQPNPPLELRNINVANTTGGPLNCTLSIGADAAATRLFPTFSIPANSLYTWSGLMPLEPGEILQAYGSGPGLTLIGGGSVGVD